MTKKSRPTFTAEFKLETAQLVVDQGYSKRQAAEAMNVSLSAIEKWVKQLKGERKGISTQSNPLTPEQIQIKALEKKLKRAELENDILKKATALYMSDWLSDLS